MNDFLDGKLALIISKDMSYSYRLQKLVEKQTEIGQERDQYGSPNASTITESAFRLLKGYACCISFKDKQFHYATKSYYVGLGCSFMSMEDFVEQYEEENKKAESDWAGLLA